MSESNNREYKKISVYDDRIVLWNAGVLPENWSVASLLTKHPSSPFNPLVANTLFRAGYIESWGRGIEKIAAECIAHGITLPDYNYEMSGLMLTFRAEIPVEEVDPTITRAKEGEKEGDKEGEKEGEKRGGKLSPNRQKIIDAMLEDPQVSHLRLVELLEINAANIGRNISFLKKNDWIQRVGPANGGGWKVLKQTFQAELSDASTPPLVRVKKEGDREGDGEGEKEGDKEGEKISINRKQIIVAMRKNPQVSLVKLAELLEMNPANIAKNINYLKENGWIQRVGPAKGGHWEVLK